jgi:excinuclease UvrABC nuclease subunit
MGDRRAVVSEQASDVCNDAQSVPSAPGVYIIRDPTGILYIGEATNLRNRIRPHVDHSTSPGLARYFWEAGMENCTIDLHTFPNNEAASRHSWRRAYERNLIESRQPRFNIESSQEKKGRSCARVG